MTFMHTRLAYRAKYGCDLSDTSTDMEKQVGPVLDQHFCVTLPVHASVLWDHTFDDDCVISCRPPWHQQGPTHHTLVLKLHWC
jgi:hypothetical protein